MTDTPEQKTAPAVTRKPGNVWAELGPTLVFVLIYNVLLRFPEGDGLLTKDTALYWATGALIVMTIGVIVQKLVKKERIPPFLIVWNIILWQFFSEETWANWRLGNMAIGFVFALANVPYTLKHMLPSEDADEAA